MQAWLTVTAEQENPQLLRVVGTEPPLAGRPVTTGPARTVRELSAGSALEDAVNGAFAALAVAGAVARYAGYRAGRHLRARRPLGFAGPGWRPLAGVRSSVARALAHPVSAAAGALAAVADELVPEVARGVLARLDVPALVREYVDIDRIAAMLDVDAVIDRVDLDAVVATVDIGAVLDRLDLDAIVERVDIARVLDRVDLDAVVARVDLDAAVATVDLDAAVDRVDVDRVIARTDIAGLARYVVDEIDLPGLLRASTGSVTTEMVRSVRDQGADADRAVERIVDRLLHRQGRRTATAAPGPDGGEP